MTLNDLANGAPLRETKETLLVYVLGGTCSGKTTFLDHCRASYSDSAGFVEVGKEFRKRYSPDHFNGQAAPTHTQGEAIDIYLEQLSKTLDSGLTKRFVFIDGQPRGKWQTEQILVTYKDYPKLFLVLDASHDTRMGRIKKRFPRWNDPLHDDYFTAKLSFDRMTSDYRMMYETLAALLQRSQHLSVFDSAESKDEIMHFLEGFHATL